MRHWNCGNIGHGSGQSVSNVNFWITLKYFMSPPLICMESEFTRAFDQSLVVISSRWRRWRSDQQAAAVPPRLYSVLGCCTAVLLSSTPAPTLWSSTGAAARETWSQVTQCYNTISCDFDTVSGEHFDTCGRGGGSKQVVRVNFSESSCHGLSFSDRCEHKPWCWTIPDRTSVLTRVVSTKLKRLKL